uniref:Bromo domain-containing protein n=1 Tax=Hucho hucho TaxID=62062 RepID=A0A4W5RBI9_9TELE
MKNNEYESVEQLDTDLTLMFENAKRCNVPHSSIYKRVLKLQHIQQLKRKELLRREDDSMDGDSMLSSTMSDTGSTKRKRYAILISPTLHTTETAGTQSTQIPGYFCKKVPVLLVYKMLVLCMMKL